MKRYVLCSAVLAMAIFTCGVATAGDFDMPIYPGAKSDADTEAMCAQPDLPFFKQREASAGITSTKHCYRTSDSLDKVVAFYKQQKGITGDKDVTGQGALFCRGNPACGDERMVGTSLTLSTFWPVPKSMKINQDVLILVRNKVKR
jgi:hypothetical protein